MALLNSALNVYLTPSHLNHFAATPGLRVYDLANINVPLVEE